MFTKTGILAAISGLAIGLVGTVSASDFDRRYLAADQTLHGNLIDAQMIMGQATNRQAILPFDAAWETNNNIVGNSFGAVVKGHDGMFRAYYQVVLGPDMEAMAVATSSDGITWTKPALNAAPHLLDNASSNIVNIAPHAAMQDGKWYGVSHVYYHEPNQTYYATWNTSNAAYIATSSDGVNFTTQTKAFDHRMEGTPSLFYDTITGQWAMYGRKRGDWPTFDPIRRGIVRHSTANPTSSWTSVGVVAVDPMDVYPYVPTQTGHPDPNDQETVWVGPDLYMPGVQVYHGQYVGLPSTYFIDPERPTPGRFDRWTGPVYPVFMHSHDGLNWNFPDEYHPIIDPTPHLRVDPHPDWPHGWSIDPDLEEVGQMYPTGNFIEHEGQLLIYYAHRNDTHNVNTDPAQPRSLNVATMRVDGFASIKADEGLEGVWHTANVNVPVGARGLLVNADVAGSLKVAVLDSEGNPIANLSLADSIAFQGDETSAFMQWSAGQFEEVAGQEVQLRFVVEDGEIYSFSFTAIPEPASLMLLGAGALLMLRRRSEQ